MFFSILSSLEITAEKKEAGSLLEACCTFLGLLDIQ
jgi:hypothetical protein